MAELQKLLKKRTRLEQTINRHREFADNITPSIEISQITVRLEQLKILWSTFETIDDQVTDHPDQDSHFEAFEEMYFNISALYDAHILSRSHSEDSDASNNDLNATFGRFIQQQQSIIETINQRNIIPQNAPPNIPPTDIRLPKLNISPFSGQYQEWPSFRDVFEQGVYNRADIPNINKFLLLKGVLTDEASKLIRHLQVTAENYTNAWNKLVERYNKNGLIINSYINLFFDQPIIHKPDASNLGRLADTSDEVTRALTSLGEYATSRDPWLIFIIMSKVDNQTRVLWANEMADTESPTFDQLIKFLTKRSHTLETPSTSSLLNSKSNSTQKTSYSHCNIAKAKLSNVSLNKCSFCKTAGHPLYMCYKFKNASLIQKKDYLRNSFTCFNCLHAGHTSASCSSEKHCTKCSLRHHTLLHASSDNFASKVKENKQNLTSDGQLNSNSCKVKSDEHSATTSLVSTNHCPLTLLPTAVVEIASAHGKSKLCRILLDSGSQRTLISEKCVNDLRLPRRRAKISVTGIANSNAGYTSGIVSIILRSRFNAQDILNADALILNKLTSSQHTADLNLKKCDISLFGSLSLADPNFNQSNEIDIIIGCDYFFDILRDGKIVGLPNAPSAHNTLFGWVLGGKFNVLSEPTIHSHFANIDLDYTLRRFWECEETPNNRLCLSEEEQFCETHFKNNLSIDDTDHFVVKLPIKRASKQLGDSLNTAVSRFHSMERKFRSDKNLHQNYKLFMNEYMSLGHMVQIPFNEIKSLQEKSFYLPHHAVIRDDKTTTKCRVVFDGSAKSSSGVSLNGILAVGPTIQPTLCFHLLHFRRYMVAFTSDVEKMYRQINVASDDQDLQRIIWRNSPQDPIYHYRLTTVTYGTSSAPFLATRCLQQIGINLKDIDPLTANTIINNFYVDDLITGADSINEAIALKKSITTALSARGFKLRKWTSNSEEFLKDIPLAEKDVTNYNFEDDGPVKILGLVWNPKNDCFSFRTNIPFTISSTKRLILSESSKLFDPLGFLSPCTITVKIMFQKLWLQEFGWDDKLPDHVVHEWINIRKQLKSIETVKINRFIGQMSTAQFHGFADASESAYAAAIYCRSTNANGDIETNLVIAKTKVAPLKQVSLPRLELCAAQLLCRLFENIILTFGVNYQSCFAYSDSTIVLAWLASIPRKWSTYVANRTSLILEIMPRNRWYHIPSQENPADIASRGTLPEQLIQHQLWWHGPKWLCHDVANWPIISNEIQETNVELKTKKIVKILSTSCIQPDKHPIISLFIQHSSFLFVIRVLCYVIRFLDKFTLKNKINQNSVQHELSSDEIITAQNICIRCIQRQEYSTEINQLESKQNINKNSSLASLAPFIDTDGILRVGGRLRKATCSFNVKHPIILPRSSIFTIRLINYLHNKHLHAGASLLLATIRQNYWIPRSRNLIRRVINNCLTCFRLKRHTNEQLMADIAFPRTQPERPFINTGIDYAGPIKLRTHAGRSFKLTKGYISLFICFSTRSIHLELVTDLTSQTFIAAFKRFVSRRGLPKNIYSDNGTNFIAASKKLKTDITSIPVPSNSEELAAYLANNIIKWHFIPPSAPHFGGLWEAGVKSVKTHINKTISNRTLTYEEYTTMLYQIEGLLNSRPLCPINESDPSGFDYLTPGHFLIGSPLTLPPEPNLLESKKGVLSRWQEVQRMQQSFWKRWHMEYLTTLQNRPKWTHETENLKIGDMVLLKEEAIPSQWPVARIIQVHSGSDGLVRTATIRTPHGVYKRPIVKLCRLPFN